MEKNHRPTKEAKSVILFVLKDKLFIQTQIPDFAGKIALLINKVRSCGKKLSKPLKRLQKIKEEIKRGVQRLIGHFIFRERPTRYVPRLKTPRCQPYKGSKLTPFERKAFQMRKYRGELKHLFLFYPWERLNRFEKGDVEFPLASRIKAHIAMCKKHIFTYSRLIEELEEKPKLLEICSLSSVPDRKTISRAVDIYGIAPFRFLFYDLARLCLRYKIMRGRFICIDGSLIKSNCNPYLKNGSYTDPGAGLYIRGKYIKGVGYLYLEALDLEYGQPMLIETYKGSSSENPLFRQVLDDFYAVYGFYPELVSQDKGSDSKENRRYCLARGIEGYLQTRDFGNGGVVYTPKSKCFKSEELKRASLDFLERIASRRSESERGHARNKWGYGRDRMPNRGENEAESYVLVTGITTLLTALTAYKVGRADLIRSPTAFSRIMP